MTLFINNLLEKKDNKSAILIIFFLISLIFIFLIFFMKDKENSNCPIAKNGVLDLRDWDFKKNGIINLRGEWKFYNQRSLMFEDFSKIDLPQPDFFLKTPGIVYKYHQKKYFSDNNYFTYKLNIKLEEKLTETLSLKFPRVSGVPVKFWVNKELVLEERSIEQNKVETNSDWMWNIVDLKPEQSSLEIVVQSNYFYYYEFFSKYQIFLGEKEQIRKEKESKLVFDTLLISSLLIISFYYFFSFIFLFQDLTYLYFSLFCLIINLKLAITGEAFLVEYFDFSYATTYKISLSYYLLISIFPTFIASLYPKDFSKKILISGQILGVVFYIFALVLPLEIFYLTLSYQIIILFFNLYCLYIIIVAVLKNREGALLFLINFSFLSIFIINDLLYFKRLINTGYYFRLGLFIFVVTQSLILLRRLINDFAQTKAMVQKLQRKNHILAKINKFRDQFIVSISQEFKLPLNNMISATQYVIANSKAFLPRDSKEELVSIIRMGKGLNYILDSFINYVKIKEGDFLVNKKELELYQTINYIMKILKSLMNDKEIKFKNDIRPQKFIVIADRDQLMQIFYNILNNLFCSIEDRIVFFKAKKENDKIQLILQMKATNILFKYQDYKARFKSEKKFIVNISDLKENIIQQLIKLQGGKVEIKKLNNKLLTITVSLSGYESNDLDDLEPVSKELAVINEISEAEEKTNLSFQDKSILIVDDESDKTNSLKEILKEEDYFIKVIKDKKRAVDKLDINYSLIILNVLVFDKFTFELCYKIRQQFKLLELPILVIFSRSNPKNLIKGFELGINDFIKKPFEISELKARVRTLITLKEKVEESIAREQDFLRAQIKPHFLYNTLDTIAYLTKDNPKQAENLILDLANYLRYSFDFENLNMSVPFKKELELIQFYINIQKARFGDKINVIYNIEEALSFDIPPLILQTIVENSIKHGILQRKKGGNIELNIKSTGNFFIIKVIDDGIGMNKEELKNLLKEDGNYEGEGKNRRRKVGLDNINQRLKKLYNQSLKIVSEEGKGTIVEFKIPKIIERGK